MSLTIDDIYTTTVNTPGRFYELNINQGLYTGSTHTADVFFGHVDAYRGCLGEVTFNGLDVFRESKVTYNSEPLYRSGVTWDCSAEFTATSDQPMSFVTNTSFVAFPGLNTRQELVQLTFDVRTRSDKCLLLYHAGATAYNADFISAEIISGDLMLTINKGNGAMEFLSREHISDGRWHQIEIVIDPLSVRLSIDGRRKRRRTNFGQNQFLDLSGYMFVGGLDVTARARALQHQLPSLGGSNAAAGFA